MTALVVKQHIQKPIWPELAVLIGYYLKSSLRIVKLFSTIPQEAYGLNMKQRECGIKKSLDVYYSYLVH